MMGAQLSGQCLLPFHARSLQYLQPLLLPPCNYSKVAFYLKCFQNPFKAFCVFLLGVTLPGLATHTHTRMVNRGKSLECFQSFNQKQMFVVILFPSLLKFMSECSAQETSNNISCLRLAQHERKLPVMLSAQGLVQTGVQASLPDLSFQLQNQRTPPLVLLPERRGNA